MGNPGQLRLVLLPLAVQLVGEGRLVVPLVGFGEGNDRQGGVVDASELLNRETRASVISLIGLLRNSLSIFIRRRKSDERRGVANKRGQCIRGEGLGFGV